MTSLLLIDILERAAHNRFPPPDGAVRVLGSPPGPSDAVVAFTGHHVVAAPVDPGDVAAVLPPDDLSAPMRPRFLGWLGDRLGIPPGTLDVVLAAVERPSGPRLETVRRDDLSNHPRVSRAGLYREEVEVHAYQEAAGVVILGRGLAGRMEVSIEIEEAHRGTGLGAKLARQARWIVPEGVPLFAQVAPGNAASLRAFLHAGFRPIGGEVLFLKHPAR